MQQVCLAAMLILTDDVVQTSLVVRCRDELDRGDTPGEYTERVEAQVLHAIRVIEKPPGQPRDRAECGRVRQPGASSKRADLVLGIP